MQHLWSLPALSPGESRSQSFMHIYDTKYKAAAGNDALKTAHSHNVQPNFLG